MKFVRNLIELLKCIWGQIMEKIGFRRRIMQTPMEVSSRDEHPEKAFGWAARDESGVLSPFKFSRRTLGEKDVMFKVLYCGICHSDLHYIKNDWGNAKYPVVPGHELVGVMTKVGRKVQKFKVGDKVDVVCLVGSCRSCEQANPP